MTRASPRMFRFGATSFQDRRTLPFAKTVKPTRHLTFVGLALLTASISAATSAEASCNDRPGTPNDVSAVPISSSSIRFNWHDTTKPGEIPLGPFYDIEVVDKNGQLMPQSTTGEGYLFGGKVFEHLDFDKTYCFRVKARTEKGTGGCVSLRWSARVCAQTPYPPFVTPGGQGKH